ncbi:MAG: hypothetical protein H0Z31_05885 [Bacillus sp. (in: Bacteria)]|nr:hypothetical protein [Bacillus sp. (in: firmicutes)]
MKIYVFEHQDFFQYYDDDYLKVFWAENKHDAVKKLVHNVSSDEAYRESLLSDDVCLELPFPSDDEYERYFVENDLRYWSVKEYEVEEGSPERKRRKRQNILDLVVTLICTPAIGYAVNIENWIIVGFFSLVLLAVQLYLLFSE